jgi:hypothetical protein
MQLFGLPHQYLRIAPAGGEAEHLGGPGFTGSPEKLQEMLRRRELQNDVRRPWLKEALNLQKPDIGFVDRVITPV